MICFASRGINREEIKATRRRMSLLRRRHFSYATSIIVSLNVQNEASLLLLSCRKRDKRWKERLPK